MTETVQLSSIEFNEKGVLDLHHLLLLMSLLLELMSLLLDLMALLQHGTLDCETKKRNG